MQAVTICDSPPPNSWGGSGSEFAPDADVAGPASRRWRIAGCGRLAVRPNSRRAQLHFWCESTETPPQSIRAIGRLLRRATTMDQALRDDLVKLLDLCQRLSPAATFQTTVRTNLAAPTAAGLPP